MRIGVWVVALLLAGCAATPAQWHAVGGSKSDGAVILAYDAGAFQSKTENAEGALVLAVSRCQGWGYSGAQPFGLLQKGCAQYNGNVCAVYRYAREFQCLD